MINTQTNGFMAIGAVFLGNFGDCRSHLFSGGCNHVDVAGGLLRQLSSATKETTDMSGSVAAATEEMSTNFQSVSAVMAGAV